MSSGPGTSWSCAIPDFEADLKESKSERDHVHLFVIYPPKVRLSELVNALKGVSSRRLKVELPAIPTFCSRGLFAELSSYWSRRDFSARSSSLTLALYCFRASSNCSGGTGTRKQHRFVGRV